jgi:hypothetical protein
MRSGGNVPEARVPLKSAEFETSLAKPAIRGGLLAAVNLAGNSGPRRFAGARNAIAAHCGNGMDWPRSKI